MDKVTVTLQVFFEDPFWIGICERVVLDKLSVSKITFGAEPKDYEIEEFVLRYWYLLSFCPATDTIVKHRDNLNPKRRQREVRNQMAHVGIGTKSQQVLKQQHEENKLARKVRTKEQKEAEADRQFILRQQKHKEKHKGR